MDALLASSRPMPLLQPRYAWRLREVVDPTAELIDAAHRSGLGERLTALLAARGHATAADVRALLEDPEAALHDPWLLPDAEAFAARVDAAARAGESVLVFGDFDADGLTGLAILVVALRARGLDARPYVPSRSEEGHGLSLRAVEHAVASGCRLIVTVDCGTASVAEIAAAGAAGIAVLVTDHHSVPSHLPAAAAIVNPHRADSRYPDPRLSGAGVAFKLAQLLLADLPGGREMALDLSDLAAIGTVADVAPLLGENRAIVRLGLSRLRAGGRVGVAALLEAARVDPARVDPEAIAFALAPRLNALGRMGEAAAAAQMLLAEDHAEAAALAAELEAANLSRRELMADVLDEARAVAAADTDGSAIVINGPWPVGIVGLIAGRLAEESGRPAVVVSTVGDPWRGSARSAAGYDLAGLFDACGDLFERHGGHPQAAGCTLAADRFEPFRTRFLTLVGPVPAPARAELVIDLAVDALEVDYRLFRELARLEPTGPGNPVPLVGVAGLVVTRVRPAAGGHCQLTVRKGREVLDAIAFDRADLLDSVAEGDRIDAVARLASRTFGGFESLQLELRDVGPEGTLLVLGSRPEVASGVA